MDGILYVLDALGRSLRQNEETVVVLRQENAELRARIAELEASHA